MLALRPGQVGAAWRALAAALPRPRAIVVVSAHWSMPQPMLGSGAQHETIHDFYGFPAALYTLRYDAPGEPALAQALAQGLSEAGLPAQLEAHRGLDHGAWIPLRELYPGAELPVVPLSINARQGPEYHLRLGQALAPLLDDNVLLLTSGGLTHNLHELRVGAAGANGSDEPAAHTAAFQAWFHQHLSAGDLNAVLDYRRQAPEAVRAHPSDEHLLPLFVALGAAGPAAAVSRPYAGVSQRTLAMDLYTFTRE